MTDAIYLVDAKTKAPVRVERVSFASIGVKERQNLEQWVIAHPELMGEPLLVITDEFNRFDKSNKRLDVLAMDGNGVLVIIELKLDVAGSYADLQAIRYAAFCSTMTMQDVIELFASHRSISKDDAEKALLEFLDRDALAELGDRPRVILAAGSIDDQEITSCVLWLRRFGLDISCVELSPYRMPDGAVVLVPKVIIPLPETRKFMVQVEKKEIAKVERSKSQAEDSELWAAVKSQFNRLDCVLKVSMNSDQPWMTVKGGNDAVHYAWWRKKRDNAVWVGIGFRSKSKEDNDANIKIFRPRQAELTGGIGLPVQFQNDWGPLTRRLYFVVPHEGTQSVESIASELAERMAKLIKLTLPSLAERGLHPA